ncbi:hypothetical protein [Methylorubrum extorquens]|uniref:Uncharacterized protein n=1 Tax=Methylorubrum extorquens (strain CM4 / NCIMB 13688) TaxID=440085 RepID=B7KU46_METC4|nr:hypothetical protein [Methylorubrum extorquens]ACK85837.1 hypothetical protein Mchl_5072 [Methylorubrum extorquens CM4]
MANRLRRWRAAARSWSVQARLLRERRLIAGSGLFDESLYLFEAPDVMREEAEPIEHFCRFGWREGRRPNLYFDPLWYRDRYLEGADRNPLVHYLTIGESAGCRPVCYFDPHWYARTYRLPSRANALAHYLAHRRSQRFAPNPDFDLAFYLDRYGVEIGPNRDPFAHHLRFGAARDIDPSPHFDAGHYRKSTMTDLTPETRTPWAAADLRVPLVHYLDTQYRRS